MLRGGGSPRHVVAQVVHGLPPGTSLVSSSSVGPACLQLLAQRRSTLAAATTDRSIPLQSDAVKRDVALLKYVRVVDADKGLLEVTNPGATSSTKEMNMRSAVLLVPDQGEPSDPCLDYARVEAAVREALVVSPSGDVVFRRSGAGGTNATVPRRVWGASHEAYVAAAQDAAAAGFRMVVVSRFRQRLCASGLDGHELSVVYPQWFCAFRMELPVDHGHAGHSGAEITVDQYLVDVIVPIVDTDRKKLGGAASVSIAADRIPRPLQPCLRSFYASARPPPRSTGTGVDAVDEAPMAPLELGASAFRRMQLEGLLPYLDTCRKALPHPVPLSMLHREIGWHHVEGSLGSLLHALPEATVLRFGDDLILPLSDAFVEQSLLPLLVSFAGAQPGKYAYVGIARFFTWTWDAAIAREHRKGNVAQGWLLSSCKRRVGDLMAYEGYLAKYFLYFPKRFRVRQIDGEMVVSFQVQ